MDIYIIIRPVFFNHVYCSKIVRSLRRFQVIPWSVYPHFHIMFSYDRPSTTRNLFNVLRVNHPGLWPGGDYSDRTVRRLQAVPARVVVLSTRTFFPFFRQGFWDACGEYVGDANRIVGRITGNFGNYGEYTNYTIKYPLDKNRYDKSYGNGTHDRYFATKKL